MSESWKNNRWVVALLAVAVIGVWGVVTYRVLTGLPSSSPHPDPSIRTPDSSTALRSKARPVSPYRGRFRDPFDPAIIDASTPSASKSASDAPADAAADTAAGAASDSRSSPEPSPQPTPPPDLPLDLLGIVDRTIVVQGTRGTTHVLESGETLDSIAVETVSDTSVVFSTTTRTDTVYLTPAQKNRDVR